MAIGPTGNQVEHFPLQFSDLSADPSAKQEDGYQRLERGVGIGQARQLRGLPQDRLGVLAGLEESSSSARISRYESGIHEPPVSFVEAVATVLEISPAFFYCADDRLAEIIRIYSGLTETKRDQLKRDADSLAD